MKYLLLFALLTGTTVQSIRQQPGWIFDNAFKCGFQWIDPIIGSNYDIDYGCYCGFFSGSKFFNNAKDLDMCCSTRDKCYAQVNKLENCGSLIRNPYYSSYLYSCSGDEIICSENNNHCEDFICNCDRQAAACFSKAPYREVFKSTRC